MGHSLTLRWPVCFKVWIYLKAFLPESHAQRGKCDSQCATIFGHYPGGVMANPIKALFDWIDQNGPWPHLKTEFTKIEVLESIADVNLEVRDVSGQLAGKSVHRSDIFTLLRTDEGWRITQKAFHWYSR